MSVFLRFAPSPTGKLHVGNLRTALFNYLFARKHGGNFMLRLDDTDLERSTDAFAQGIRDDLRHLGFHPDREMKQSDRFPQYRAAAARLLAAGRLYAAYDTPDELERKRKRLLAKSKPPVYDRAALQLSEADRAALEAEGRRPHYRFLLEPGTVEFHDLIRGRVAIDTAALSDPVLIREDDTFLYTLCSVVDDIDAGITHVIRGEDHVTNTAVQVQIFRALGAEPPIFAHHPLLTDAAGEKLSKRLGSLSAEALHEAGIEPAAVVSYLARLGTSDPIVPFLSVDEAAADFDLSKVSHSAARFVPDDLQTLNAKILATLPFEAVRERLSGEGEAFWTAVRGNLSVFDDVQLWRRVVRGPSAPAARDNEALLDAAVELLPAGAFDHDTWKAWTRALAERTGLKGRALFLPLRIALTGLDHGPEMAALLPLIGRAETLRRLLPEEQGGYENKPEPTRFGDWEKKGGIISDF